MAGLCTAIAAARCGIKVILVHDRPVLGGNASSEIRMWIGGAYVTGWGPVKDIREGGIIEEIFLENFYQNPSLKYPLWDSVLYQKAKADFGETIPPDTADSKTMGMSCLFQIRETDHKVEFTPPSWAYSYESDDDLPYKPHRKTITSGG